MPKPIEIRTSPHLKRAISVDRIMRNVVFALLPICAFAVFQFGLSALLLLLTTTGVAIATEWFFSRMSERGSTVSDWSVVITGMLLGLTLPPGFPLWMAAVAAFVGVALGKALFGGLGYNVMNPALVGRAFVQAAFPVAITTWTPAFAPGRFVELIPSTLTMPFMRPEPVADWVAGLNLDGLDRGDAPGPAEIPADRGPAAGQRAGNGCRLVGRDGVALDPCLRALACLQTHARLAHPAQRPGGSGPDRAALLADGRQPLSDSLVRPLAPAGSCWAPGSWPATWWPRR